jgi:SAM-dependent methyltransferase
MAATLVWPIVAGEPDFVRRTRESYDATADDYVRWIRGELAAKPYDRAVLSVFASLVPGPVVDVGCGPGRVTAFLSELGVAASGVDLSPGMVAAARRAHPALRFEVGSMLSLDIPSGSLGGVLAWYSIIHVPDGLLPDVFAEFHRVLAPGGLLQLAFQVGDDPLHLTSAGGHAVSLVFHRRRPAAVTTLLAAAGSELRAELWRAADEAGEFPERTPQAYLLARKPIAGC